MKKILNIITSPRGDASYSNKLGNAVIGKIKSEYPGSRVITRDLTTSPLPHVDANELDAFLTPLENHTEAHKQATKISDDAIYELFDVDVIVINVAMWNFAIPSSLKAWIDQIARAGITFGFSEKGPVGLITGKKVYVVMATGGIYSEIPDNSMDFVEPYLKFILGFLGMTDVTFLRVEGLAINELRETALEKALKTVEKLEISAQQSNLKHI